MKVLLFGANGFIGRAVRENLSVDHEVHAAIRSENPGINEHNVDLLALDSVKKVIEAVRPEVIINSAGIVDSNADTMQNVTFTKNILQAVNESDLAPKRIVISGSAGEYGRIDSDELPTSETVPLRADAGYGLAKKIEEETALGFREKDQLPVVVARIFNPIGTNMAERFLVSRLKKQIDEYVAGERTTLEVSRKDANRDYIAVDDIAKALRVLIEGDPVHGVYNIGSGTAMSNGELLQLMVDSSKIENDPEIVETSPNPEPLVASQADITRLKQEFNWEPQHNIADIVQEIMNDKKTD